MMCHLSLIRALEESPAVIPEGINSFELKDEDLFVRGPNGEFQRNIFADVPLTEFEI